MPCQDVKSRGEQGILLETPYHNTSKNSYWVKCMFFISTSKREITHKKSGRNVQFTQVKPLYCHFFALESRPSQPPEDLLGQVALQKSVAGQDRPGQN